MTPPLVVAACDVVMSLYTTHGWRPTSVTIQPPSPAPRRAPARGHDPAALHGHQCGRPAEDSEPPEPGLPGQTVAAAPCPQSPETGEEQQEGQPDHGVEG